MPKRCAFAQSVFLQKLSFLVLIVIINSRFCYTYENCEMLYWLVMSQRLEITPLFCSISRVWLKLNCLCLLGISEFPVYCVSVSVYRAYRIGQRRDVRVYRLISSGTIEEMIYLRQVYKQVFVIDFHMARFPLFLQADYIE